MWSHCYLNVFSIQEFHFLIWWSEWVAHLNRLSRSLRSDKQITGQIKTHLFMTLLLLFRHSAKSTIAQKEYLVTSPKDYEVPSIARDTIDVSRALNRCFYPHNGNDGLSWRLSIISSWPIRLPIQEWAMDLARSATQGVHNYEGTVNWLEIQKSVHHP